jgi:hypothetical protein
MATNFAIHRRRRNRDLHLGLSGDFDGSSAFELVHCLHNALETNHRIFVHTDRLSHLLAFGTEMFHKQLRSGAKTVTRIVFTGVHASRMAPEGSRMKIS